MPERLILERLKDDISKFIPEESDQNIKSAIDWAFKYKMLAQAYTLGQEFIISLVCKKLEHENPFTKDKEGERNFRMYVSAILSINDKDVVEQKFEGKLDECLKLTEQLLFHTEWIIQLRKEYKLLSDNRNTINHAKGTITANQLEIQFEKSYHRSLEILNPIS
jgi:hypothetical protein